MHKITARFFCAFCAFCGQPCGVGACADLAREGADKQRPYKYKTLDFVFWAFGAFGGPKDLY